MKICFIAGTLGRGGAERQLIYMLRALESEGINARVLCLTQGEALENEIIDLGIEVRWIGPSKNQVVRLLKIIVDLKTRPVDIVQSAHFYTNIYVAVAAKILRIIGIGAIRSDVFHEMTENRLFGRWQLRLPGNLIGNSKRALERARDLGAKPESLHIVRNVAASNNGRRSLTSAKECTNILFVGRLVPAKNPELFIRMASRLVRDLPEHNLLFQIAGDGPLRKGLQEYAGKCPISNSRVQFLGERADMSDIYRETDILVLTSDHEGTPNVVLEAMSYGIPVVATNVGGVPEILSEDCGFLLRASDLDGLCRATAKLVRDQRLRSSLGGNGRRYVLDNHSLPYLADRLTGIYSKLLGGDQ